MENSNTGHSSVQTDFRSSCVTVEHLKEKDFVSTEKSFEALLQGLDPKNVNSKPVLDMQPSSLLILVSHVSKTVQSLSDF